MSSTSSDLVASTVLEQVDRETLPTSVYRQSWGTSFFVQIRHKGTLYYLGTYDTVSEAVGVRDEARRQLERQ
jgi:hypothetical protein